MRSAVSKIKPDPQSLISAFLQESLEAIDLPPGARILDIPVGFGRHAAHCAQKGHVVIAADIDFQRLDYVRHRAGTSVSQDETLCVQLDATLDLPLKASHFDAVISVDYYAEDFLRRVESVLKVGGYLIYETYDGRGGNWRGLPKPGRVKELLSQSFEFVTYRERAVGPTKTEASVVKLLARKIFGF